MTTLRKALCHISSKCNKFTNQLTIRATAWTMHLGACSPLLGPSLRYKFVNKNFNTVTTMITGPSKKPAFSSKKLIVLNHEQQEL